MPLYAHLDCRFSWSFPKKRVRSGTRINTVASVQRSTANGPAPSIRASRAISETRRALRGAFELLRNSMPVAKLDPSVNVGAIQEG